MPIPGKKPSAIIQSVAVSQNASTGIRSSVATTVDTVNASFHPLSATESLIFNKDTTEVTHVMRVDHSQLGDTNAATLKAKNGAGLQVVIDSKTYDIRGVVEWNTTPSRHYRVNLRDTDVDN